MLGVRALIGICALPKLISVWPRFSDELHIADEDIVQAVRVAEPRSAPVSADTAIARQAGTTVSAVATGATGSTRAARACVPASTAIAGEAGTRGSATVSTSTAVPATAASPAVATVPAVPSNRPGVSTVSAITTVHINARCGVLGGGSQSRPVKNSRRVAAIATCSVVPRGTNPSTAVPAIAPMPAMPMDQAACSAVTSVGTCATVSAVAARAVASGAAAIATVHPRTGVAAVAGVAAVPACVAAIATVMSVAPVTAQGTSVAAITDLILRARRAVIREPITHEQTCIRFLGCAIAIEHIDTGCGFIGNALDDLVNTTGARRSRGLAGFQKRSCDLHRTLNTGRLLGGS